MNDGLILIVVLLYAAGALATHLWARSAFKDWQAGLAHWTFLGAWPVAILWLALAAAFGERFSEH
jgi:hypothetical protein